MNLGSPRSMSQYGTVLWRSCSLFLVSTSMLFPYVMEQAGYLSEAPFIRAVIHSINWTSLVAQMVKHLPAVQETWVWSLGWEDPLEKGMASHASTLAWAILWIEEPGRLQSMGLQRVRHDWKTSLSVSAPLMRFWPHNLNTFQRPTTECYHLGIWSSKYEFGKYKNIQPILLLNEMKIYIAGLVICHFFWFFFCLFLCSKYLIGMLGSACILTRIPMVISLEFCSIYTITQRKLDLYYPSLRSQRVYI